jgi:hypothetical protein
MIIKIRTIFLYFLCAFFQLVVAAEKDTTCFQDAIEKAPELLKYHAGPLVEGLIIDIDRDSVKKLKSMRNPAEPNHYLTVIEVHGNIYKGNYRIRFIFSTKSVGCLLVGQEVLEVDKF